MKTVNMHEAKTRLSELVKAVETRKKNAEAKAEAEAAAKAKEPAKP